MYPLKSRNVPLGVHVPQFGNPWSKIYRPSIFFFFCTRLFYSNTNLCEKNVNIIMPCASGFNLTRDCSSIYDNGNFFGFLIGIT